MRILITAGIFPPEVGGPATYIPAIADALVQQSHSVTVIAPQRPGAAVHGVRPSFQLIRYPRAVQVRYLNYFVEMGRALRAISSQANRSDLIYANGLDLPAAINSFLHKKPLVIKITGDPVWELAHSRGWTSLDLERFQSARSFRYRFFRMLYHLPARRARRVIVPSRYMAKIVQGWGIPPYRVRVIYNALSPPKKDQPVSLPEDLAGTFHVLVVGRLIPLKRVNQVIDAIAGLEGVDLVIAGSGSLSTALQEQATALGLGKRVFFTGQISQAQVWWLLRHYADVLVLNSIHETFPHILVEAACCGLPVIATQVGGAPEIVAPGKSGLLIPPDSPADLQEALRRLKENAMLRQALGDQALRMAERFNFDRMVAETGQALQEALP